MKIEFGEHDLPGLSANRPAAPDHNVRRLDFDLPNSLLAQVVMAGTAYLAIMYVAFRGGVGLGLIFAVFGLVLVAYYGLPLLMQKTSGRDAEGGQARSDASGIETASGHLSFGAAFAQVMTVPLLMVAWAVIMMLLH